MKTLYHNGAVASLDAKNTRYEAIGWEDGIITFLGTSTEGLEQKWDRVKDLRGAMVTPSFTDTHLHAFYTAFLGRNLPLQDVTSVEELVSRCRKFVQGGKEHVFAMGWNQEHLAEGRMPTRGDLDRASAEKPVCALRCCAHLAVVNSAAVELLRQSDIPEELAPNVDLEAGILKEGAIHLYTSLLPHVGEEYLMGLIGDVQEKLHAKGITGIHSDDLTSVPGCGWRDIVGAYTRMEAEGRLKLRVYEQCLVDDEAEFAALCERTDLRGRDARFRLGPRKLLQDGSLGARSACMLEGYPGEPDNHGIPTYGGRTLYEKIKAAHSRGVDVACHAIGDGALEEYLTALERVLSEQPRPHRHGVVHCQVARPEQQERMARLGVQAYIQPIFLNSDVDILPSVLTDASREGAYAWKSFLRRGIHCSGGSDCPVEPFDIMNNLYCAVKRKNLAGDKEFLPEEALTVEEALRLFTADAAWASGDEGRRGTLTLGMQADLAVLGKDLFAIAPEELPAVPVLETILGGEAVYLRS